MIGRALVLLLLLPGPAAAWSDPAGDAVYRLGETETDPVYAGGDILEVDARVVEDVLRVSVRLEMALTDTCSAADENHIVDALNVRYAFGSRRAHISWWMRCSPEPAITSFWTIDFSGLRRYPEMTASTTANGTWHTWDLDLEWHGEPGDEVEFWDWIVQRERRDGAGVQVDIASDDAGRIAAIGPAPVHPRAHLWTDAVGDAEFRVVAGPAVVPAPPPDELKDIHALDVEVLDTVLRLAVLLDKPMEAGCSKEAKYTSEALTIRYKDLNTGDRAYQLSFASDCWARSSETGWGRLGGTAHLPEMTVHHTAEGAWHVWAVPLAWHGSSTVHAFTEWSVELDQTYTWITHCRCVGGEYAVHQTDEALWRNATIGFTVPAEAAPLEEPPVEAPATERHASAPEPRSFVLPWPERTDDDRASLAALMFAALLAVLVVRPRLGGFLLTLFTRIREDRLLEHPRRRRIREVLQARPGITFTELRQELATGPGTLIHHLTLLERAQVVRRVPMAGHTHFFCQGRAPRPRDVTKGTRRRILRLIEENPGLDQKEIARRVGVTRESAGQHVRAMAADGLLATVADGRRKRYHPDSPGPSWTPGGSR